MAASANRARCISPILRRQLRRVNGGLGPFFFLRDCGRP